MKTEGRYLFLLLSIVITMSAGASGCTKSLIKDKNNENAMLFKTMPQVTTNGRNLIAFEIEGEPYVYPNIRYNKNNITSDTYGLYVSEYKEEGTKLHLKISHERYEEKFNPGSLFIDLIIPDDVLKNGKGKIDFMQLTSYGKEGYPFHEKFSIDLSKENPENQDKDIEIIISKIDTEKRILCGTFSCKEKNVRRIHGFFDLKECYWKR